MNSLFIVSSITLVQLPALFLRYLPFSKLITLKTKKKLLICYSSCFAIQHIILYLLLKYRLLNITPLSYKILILILSSTYVMTNMIIIKGYFYQHLFIFNMQGGYSFFIHSIVAIFLARCCSDLPIHIQFLIQTTTYSILFIIFAIPLWKNIKNSLVFKKSISQHFFWNVIWLIPMLAVYGNFIATLNQQWICSWQQLLSRFIMIFAIIISWKCINLNFEKLDQMLTLENTNKMLVIQNKAIKNQSNIIQENTKKISILKHDMRHNLLLISSLIKQQKYSEASSFISSVDTLLQNTKSITFCKNSIINSALLVYITKAEEYHIEVKTDIYIPENIPWNSHDLAILFANALENAVIASKKQDDANRVIHIIAKFSAKQLVITIKNYFDGVITFDSTGFPVTKEADHGIGIQSIMSIVEKYQAHVSFSHNKNWFTLSFLFVELLLKDMD